MRLNPLTPILSTAYPEGERVRHYCKRGVIMTTYTYTDARQNFAAVLDKAKQDG
ncbi:MAG: type II toxin-antitoxin system Phd/YefM family antitoxin [Calditrichales bacterium]|nr:type II toxin-antitoxin system Phd/YefM family antitoxin [Calditrichales bacterium]